MFNILSLLGIDEEDFTWMDLSLCKHMDTSLFYDDYESDPNVARMVDKACLSCPVMKQCMEFAMDNSEWGCWGGIYMVNGKPDKNKNLHKSVEDWEEIRKRIG